MPPVSPLPLPILPGYTFRPVERPDLPAVHAMLLQIAAVDRTGFVESLEDLNDQFEDSWCEPGKDSLLALTNTGQVAATGRIYVNPTPQHERRANLDLNVHPEQLGRGLEAVILSWIDDSEENRQIVSFSINFVWLENNQREGIAEGVITELGTRRPWRNHGVASALVCASMRAFKAAGLDFAGLGVDVDSPTGALRPYERLGFKVIRRSITYAKPVN